MSVVSPHGVAATTDNTTDASGTDATSTTDAGTEPTGTSAELNQCLLMPVGSEWYLVDMRWLQEVVAEPTISELPTAPGSILGLFNLRGEIVPLFDTGVLLGLAPTASAPFALVVETDLGPAGLAATGVPESVPLPDPIGDSETAGGMTVHAFGDRIATLLDPTVLLSATRIGGGRP